jgi:hypothetical protein
MDEWFCNIGGREIGPLSSRQLKAMADRGQIVPTDNVRRGAAGHWTTANHVRGLFAADQTAPPAPPPTPPSAPPPVPPPPPSIFTSPVPNVAWPKEEPAPEPERPAPPPLPPPSSAEDAEDFVGNVAGGDAGGDNAVPFDPFAEPESFPSSRKVNLALTARARRKRQQQMLLTGSLVFVVCGVVVAIVLLMIGNFGGTEVKSEPKPAAESGQQAKKSEKAASKKTSDDAKPSDANELRTVVGDVPVRVVSVVRGGGESNPCLLITVEVKNPDPREKREFGSWSRDATQRGAVLTDDHGKAYPAKAINVAAVLGTTVPSSIGPSESVRDVLAFEPPERKVESLHLELPGEAFGKNAAATFKILGKMISEKAVVVKPAPDASKSGETKKERVEPKPGTPEYDFGIKSE